MPRGVGNGRGPTDISRWPMNQLVNQPPPPNSSGPERPVLCPYCGTLSRDMAQCDACRGHFDPLSRQATQNHMGAWFLRDAAHPFRPGCSFETIRQLAAKGRIVATSIIRGPTTRQFWTLAGRAPSIANLLGECHNCQAKVSPDDPTCPACGASFMPEPDRQRLGLAGVHLLPGQASAEAVAASTIKATRSTPPPLSGGRGRGSASHLPGGSASAHRASTKPPLHGGTGRHWAAVALAVGAAAAILSAAGLRRADLEPDHAPTLWSGGAALRSGVPHDRSGDLCHQDARLISSRLDSSGGWPYPPASLGQSHSTAANAAHRRRS